MNIDALCAQTGKIQVLSALIAAILLFAINAAPANANEYQSAGERYAGIIRKQCKLDDTVVRFDKAADGSGSYLWILPNPALGEKFTCALRAARTYGVDWTLAPYGKWPAKKDIDSCYDQIDFSGWPGGQRTDCDTMALTLQMTRMDGVLINIYAELDAREIDSHRVQQAQLAFKSYAEKTCAIASRTESAPSAESNGLFCMARLTSNHIQMLLDNPVELMLKDAMNKVDVGNAVTQSRLDEITFRCGLPQSALTLEAGNQVRFEPPKNMKFEPVDCALGYIRTLSGIKFGFVGNEVSLPKEGNNEQR